MENIKNNSQTGINENPRPSSVEPHPEEGTSHAFHFFLYLVSFLSLLFTAIGAGTILFQIINKNIADELGRYYNFFSDEVIRFGLSALIIAAPIYFILSFLIAKYLRQSKINENSKVRKWLTYIILFLASAIIIGDLIALVNGVLDGEIIFGFILKTLTILAIAGSVLGYYLWDVRKRDMAGKKYLLNKIFAVASIAALIAVFIGGLFMVESPVEARKIKIDNQTVETLNTYRYEIENYYTQNKKLPESLGDLRNKPFLLGGASDSITYKITGEISYELCAEFQRSNMDGSQSSGSYSLGAEWKHKKGNHCFSKSVTRNPLLPIESKD